MSPVKIAAVADVHSPRFLNEFRTGLSTCEIPDIFLFAGDMINRGKVDEYPEVLDILNSHLGSDFPIIACFGNEEPIACRDELHLITQNRVTFLDEKSVTFNISGSSIAIVGMSATYEPPNEVAEMRTSFEERSHRLSNLLQDASKNADCVILLMHFSPLLETDSTEFSWWVSRAIARMPPAYIVHGHVHDNLKNETKIGATTIRNVALPAIGSITELNVWD
ncbi:MAG: metallophosphoesterase family protein [Candidatus Thorarchaeota archaeon]|jgi:Icc-related predicted phosphoesterase